MDFSSLRPPQPPILKQSRIDGGTKLNNSLESYDALNVLVDDKQPDIDWLVYRADKALKNITLTEYGGEGELGFLPRLTESDCCVVVWSVPREKDENRITGQLPVKVNTALWIGSEIKLMRHVPCKTIYKNYQKYLQGMVSIDGDFDPDWCRAAIKQRTAEIEAARERVEAERKAREEAERLRQERLAQGRQLLQQAIAQAEIGALTAALGQAEALGCSETDMAAAVAERARLVEERKQAARTLLQERLEAGDLCGLRAALQTAQDAMLATEECDTAREQLAELRRALATTELTQAVEVDEEAQREAAFQEAVAAGVSEEVVQRARCRVAERRRQQASAVLASAASADDGQLGPAFRAALAEAQASGVAASELMAAQAQVDARRRVKAAQALQAACQADDGLNAAPFQQALAEAQAVGVSEEQCAAAVSHVSTRRRERATTALQQAMTQDDGQMGEAFQTAVDEAKAAGVVKEEIETARSHVSNRRRERASEALRVSCERDDGMDSEDFQAAVHTALEAGVAQHTLTAAKVQVHVRKCERAVDAVREALGRKQGTEESVEEIKARLATARQVGVAEEALALCQAEFEEFYEGVRERLAAEAKAREEAARAAMRVLKKQHYTVKEAKLEQELDLVYDAFCALVHPDMPSDHVVFRLDKTFKKLDLAVAEGTGGPEAIVADLFPDDVKIIVFAHKLNTRAKKNLVNPNESFSMALFVGEEVKLARMSVARSIAAAFRHWVNLMFSTDRDDLVGRSRDELLHQLKSCDN